MRHHIILKFDLECGHIQISIL